jgi:hypothetical protein
MATFTPRPPYQQGTSPRFGQVTKIIPDFVANQSLVVNSIPFPISWINTEIKTKVVDVYD